MLPLGERAKGRRLSRRTVPDCDVSRSLAVVSVLVIALLMVTALAIFLILREIARAMKADWFASRRVRAAITRCRSCVQRGLCNVSGFLTLGDCRSTHSER